MLFLVGLLLAVCGFAMLVVGEFPWLGGRRMPARPSRIAGALFLAFFPLYLGIRFLVKRFEIDELFEPAPIYWSLAVLCLVGGVVVLFRGAPPAVRRQVTRHVLPEPFVEEEAAAPPTLPAPGRRRGAGPVEKNPFDFS